MPTKQAYEEGQEPNTLLVEDPSLYHGFVQLPKLVLYARNPSRDAKLLYAILLGYAWQEKRCFPGYDRLCGDMDATENTVRKCMHELEFVHLLSQRRRGLGRTNIYTLHDLRTAKIEVQEHHKIAVAEPQESEDNEEAVKKQTEEKQSGIRNSRGLRIRKEEPLNEALFTHSPVLSTAKDSVSKSLARHQTQAITPIEQNPTPPQSNEANGKGKGGRKKGTAQAHQLATERTKVPDWLPGYIIDFSREFHDEAATPSTAGLCTYLSGQI